VKWSWLALAGCNQILGIDHTSLERPDARPDAPPCLMPAIYDTFDTAPPCSAWGYATQDTSGTTVAVAGGELVIAPAPNVQNTFGGCAPNGDIAFDADSGVFVEVDSPPDGSEYMHLHVDWSGSASVSLIGFAVGSVVYVRDNVKYGTATFDPAQPIWGRMHPLRDGSAIVAETSPDGMYWTQFASDPVAPPTMIKVGLIGGTFFAEPSPAAIRFAAFDICP
jgi:hypothetical protein